MERNSIIFGLVHGSHRVMTTQDQRFGIGPSLGCIGVCCSERARLTCAFCLNEGFGTNRPKQRGVRREMPGELEHIMCWFRDYKARAQL